MLSVSLELLKKACMEKAGLKDSASTIDKESSEDSFPLFFRLSSDGKKYRLQIYSEEVEELSTILSYALFSETGEMLCMAKTEFYSPDYPFYEVPYTQLIPEISSCALCKKKLSGECEGR